MFLLALFKRSLYPFANRFYFKSHTNGRSFNSIISLHLLHPNGRKQTAFSFVKFAKSTWVDSGQKTGQTGLNAADFRTLNSFGLKGKTWRGGWRLSMAFCSTNLASPNSSTLCERTLSRAGVCWGQITVRPSWVNYTVRCRGGHWDGGLDKHMVGTTNVVSFMHNDSQTTTLPVQPDTLLQTYLCVQVCICVCVCGPYTLTQAYQTVKNTNDDRRRGKGGVCVWLCNQRRLVF